MGANVNENGFQVGIKVFFGHVQLWSAEETGE